MKEEVVEFKFEEDNRFMFFMEADSQYDATEDSITKKRKQTQEKIDKSIKDSIDNVYKKEIQTTIKLYRKRNYADAFAEFLHYSEHNYYAQYYLGEMYYHGKGVSVDYAEALMWYEKAANQGYCDAPYKLAYCYEKGRGTSKNKKLALKWYRVAAEGNGRASYKAEIY